MSFTGLYRTVIILIKYIFSILKSGKHTVKCLSSLEFFDHYQGVLSFENQHIVIENEKQLIDAFKEGSIHAFQEIFDLYYARLIYYADSLVGNGTYSEDFVQDSFVKLWNKRQDFESVHFLKSFLYIATKNTCLNHLKREKVRIKAKKNVITDRVAENFAEHMIIKAEMVGRLKDAIEKLPSRCREVVQRSYIEEMSNVEVANEMKVSVNTVKTQKLRALRYLKLALENMALSWLVLLHL